MESGIFSSVAKFFEHGGFWMWPIFAAQVLSIAIIAERLVALYLRRKPVDRRQLESIEINIKKGQLDAATSKAKELALEHPLGSVVLAGANAAHALGGRDEIQSKMDEVLVVENARLQKRTVYLAMLGNVGTLLGLLGTIVGMITSFAAISEADPVQKSNLLAKGISEAMNATAYGLIVAIPALVMFTVLQNRAQSLFEDLNHNALRIFNMLSYQYESMSSNKKPRTGLHG